jgi:hypothetical protein
MTNVKRNSISVLRNKAKWNDVVEKKRFFSISFMESLFKMLLLINALLVVIISQFTWHCCREAAAVVASQMKSYYYHPINRIIPCVMHV